MEHLVQNERSRNFINYYLPFYTLLAPYKIGPLSLGSAGLILAAVQCLISHRGRIRVRRELGPFLLFWAWCLGKSFIVLLCGKGEFSAGWHTLLEMAVLMVSVLIICSGGMDRSRLYRVWKIAGAIYMAGILYHVFQILVLGRAVFPISLFPGFQLRPVPGTRPTSFFSEPAAFSFAMLPLLYFTLDYREYRWAAAVSVSLVLSTSTSGIILMVLMWILMSAQNRTLLKSFAVLAAAGAAFFTLPVFSYGREKLLSVLAGGSTFNTRVMNGFRTIQAQTPLEWVFGTLYTEPMRFVAERNYPWHQSVIAYINAGRLFFNTAANLIFQYGLIGFALYLFSYLQFFFRKNRKAKILCAINLIAIFEAAMSFGALHWFYVLLILLEDEAQNTIQNNGG